MSKEMASTASPSSLHQFQSPIHPLPHRDVHVQATSISSPSMTAGSSSTSRSQSPSPPSTRRNSKIVPIPFSFPTLKISTAPRDSSLHEKLPSMSLPGPGPGAARHSHSHGHGNSQSHSRTGSVSTAPLIGLRKRRMLGQAALVLGMLFGGVYYLGLPEVQSLSPRQWEKSPMRGNVGDDTDLIIPGVLVGSGGTFHGAPDMISDPESESELGAEIEPEAEAEAEIDVPPDPLANWGLDLRGDRLVGGITPWPPNPPVDPDAPALSELGSFADNVYKLGHPDFESYRDAMSEFAQVAFPKAEATKLKAGLQRYLGSRAGWDQSEDEVQSEQAKGDDKENEAGAELEAWDVHKRMWQTDKDTRQAESNEVGSWRDGVAQAEGWQWELMTDKKADAWVAKKLRRSRIEQMWNAFPTGILRSDALRYLLLLLEGGIYSDTDTRLLKNPSIWGHSASLWRNGEGWLDEARRKRIVEDGEDVDDVLGRPSVIVGIEADVGGREDWFDWWPRPMQIVQWTMASAPHHPIALNALLRVLHETAHAIDWAQEHAVHMRQLNTLGRYKEAKALARMRVLDDEKVGGAGGVMAWTGPGVWTDAVLSYLRIKFGMNWTDLKDLRQPLRVGEIVILPVTGFSPGVGNFGSQPGWHPQAMVEHLFRGSWKNN